jgi:chemotaxis signal transduction protein
VIGLTPEQIAPAPRLGTLVDVAVVAAMARAGQDFMPILDLERLLASDEVRSAIEQARIRGAA